MSYTGGMSAVVVPMHLGALHPMETLAMAALSLGPFLVLAAVITVVSRRDRRAEAGRPGEDQATREATAGRDGTGATTTDTAAPQSVQQ
jgi:hypothetical protein